MYELKLPKYVKGNFYAKTYCLLMKLHTLMTILTKAVVTRYVL